MFYVATVVVGVLAVAGDVAAACASEAVKLEAKRMAALHGLLIGVNCLSESLKIV